MPGGGQLASVVWASGGNAAGQHAFLAQLQDGTGALFLLGSEGKVSPVLRSGAATPSGTIAEIDLSAGVVLNTPGQIALGVRFVGSPNEAIILLNTTMQSRS